MAHQGLPWELRGRGLKDSLRHDDRVKDAIRKNLRELIAEEAIITSDGQKIIKIPMRYLEQYRFKYGEPDPGVGQGSGTQGDLLGKRGGNGNGPDNGIAGDQPGELTYEVEITLDDLTRMMVEDLALPWLEEKRDKQVSIESHQRWDTLRRRGPMATLDKKRMLCANIRRNAAGGDPHIGKISDDDRRHRVSEPANKPRTNAAVYMLMDRSGSMTTGKKYMAKSFFFWMVRFLRLKYQEVQTVFIAHDAEASVVPEQDFFALSNSGGTLCSSAYKIALGHISQHHAPERWNIYLFHFSDGDNMPHDNAVCKTLVQDLLGQCNMVGYGEIRLQDAYGWNNTSPMSNVLIEELRKIEHDHIACVTLTQADDVWRTLQLFLRRDMASAHT